MRIVFATTLSLHGATVQGRIIPLAREFSSRHSVTVLVLNKLEQAIPNVGLKQVGQEPFTRTARGKERLTRWSLFFNVFRTSLNTTRALWQLQPNIVVIAKPLPHNVFGVWLWWLFHRWSAQIILDVDDFELEANILTSLWQRAALHAAELTAVRMATVICVASPFLFDRYEQIGGHQSKRVYLMATGIHLPPGSWRPPPRPALLYSGSLSVSSGHRVDLLGAILREVQVAFPDIKLVIAGFGDNEKEIRDELQKTARSAEVHWFGPYAENDIPTLLNQSTVMLDPIDDSITQRAKSSFRVLAGATVGMPVVTSAIGIRSAYIPAQLHDRFFATPADARSYAEKIINLLQHPLTTGETKLLQEHVVPFQWQLIAQHYEATFSV